MIKKFFLFVGVLIFSIFSLLQFVNADTNGVWNYATDLRGGIFGNDEQPITNYTFVNKVYFNDNTYFNKNIYSSKIIDIKNNAYSMNLSGESNVNILVSNNLYVNNNIGIGTNNPQAKLDVNGDIYLSGGIKLGNVTNCINGVIRYSGSDFEGCLNGNWISLTEGSDGGSGGIELTDDLVNSIHNVSDCYALSGSVEIGTDGVSLFCKTPGVTCPTGWIRYVDNGVGWSETQSTYYPGGSYTSWCETSLCEIGIPPCSSGYHVWSRTEILETCTSATAVYVRRGCY